jgi:hypothetical protein
MKWIFVLLVVIGDVFIVCKNRIGFIIWILCDGFFCLSSLNEGRLAETLVFGMYAILGIWGYLKWKN